MSRDDGDFWRREETYAGEWRNMRRDLLQRSGLLTDLELLTLQGQVLMPHYQAFDERIQALEELLRRLDMGLVQGHKNTDLYRRVRAIINHMGKDLMIARTQAVMGHEPQQPPATPQRVTEAVQLALGEKR